MTPRTSEELRKEIEELDGMEYAPKDKLHDAMKLLDAACRVMKLLEGKVFDMECDVKDANEKALIEAVDEFGSDADKGLEEGMRWAAEHHGYTSPEYTATEKLREGITKYLANY